MTAPEFVPPELCKVAAKPPSGANWAHEVKFDGYRLQLRVESHRAVLRTRGGLEWSAKFPEIVDEAKRFPDCILDGEVVGLNEEGISDFAKLQEALSKGETGALRFFLFDLLFLDGRDLRREPLSRRKAALEALLNRHKPKLRRLFYVTHFRESGNAMLDAACRMRLEGIISKRLDAPYRSGRSSDWLKIKCRGGQEVVIGGWWGNSDHLRSLLVGVFRGGALRYMGRVGTGFNAGNARELLKRLKPLRRASAPFADKRDIPKARGVNWVEPKLVAEVEFGTITEAGLLRQASYKGLREDKEAGAVMPEPQPAASQRKRSAPRARRDSNSAVVSGVTITNAQKELWPADAGHAAVTKIGLARYYESAAARILPHITGRPLSIVRAPDGIDGQRFFQRHAPPGTSEHVRPIKVEGESKPFLAVDSIEGLVALAQAAVLEIHPWGSKKNDPEIPARIVFDLDPAPDVPFDQVVQAAKRMRVRLEECGLAPFLKTTGGKGLHVVVAITGSPRKPATWPEAKDFARSLCEAVARHDPDLYTTNMSKRARGGKIFLDYLRNDRMATAVAPWSPRARPHAPIALPLAWKELRTSVDPSRFTVLDATKLLRRADPWKDLEASAGSLHKARATLGP